MNNILIIQVAILKFLIDLIYLINLIRKRKQLHEVHVSD